MTAAPAAGPSGSPTRPTRIVLVAGTVRTADRVGHHDYLGGCRLLASLLEQTPGVSAALVCDGWPDDETVLDGAHSLVFYNAGGRKQGHCFTSERIERIQKRVDDGVGMVAIHRAVHFPPELAERARGWLGGVHLPPVSGRGHWWTRHRDLPQHPVTGGVRPWTIRDGWLNGIQFVEEMHAVTPLVWAGRWHRGSVRGGPRDVVGWAYEGPDGHRAFAFTGVDAHRAWSVPGVRQLVVNGILWSAGRDVPEQGAPCVLGARELDGFLTPRVPRSRIRRLWKTMNKVATARARQAHA